MFARALLSFHPAPLSAIGQNFANSNYSRTYGPLSRNSNYSRTYATPRGGGILRSSLRSHRSLPASPFAESLTQKQGVGVSSQYQLVPSGSVLHYPARLRRRPLQRISSTRHQSPISRPSSPVAGRWPLPPTSHLSLSRVTVASVVSNLFTGVLACVNPCFCVAVSCSSPASCWPKKRAGPRLIRNACVTQLNTFRAINLKAVARAKRAATRPRTGSLTSSRPMA